MRQAPHSFHALLPRVDDPVVQESYRRTGTVIPAQVHGKWYEWLQNNPRGKFVLTLIAEKQNHFSMLWNHLIDYSLVTLSELVQTKEFDDLTFYKLLFSVGGGSYSTREGALFNVIKVSIIKLD